MDSIAVNIPAIVICLQLLVILTEEVDLMQPAEVEDYCQFETFNPRCLKNEVILMRSATYGRMRVGRCITAEEVEAQKAAHGDDPRYLGCSADVLTLLDGKCSGKTECQVRLSDISAENIKPCVPGLISYLELSYGCLAVVDEERSCSVVVSMQPIHIIGSSESKRICGSQFQPWILEAPIGQKIRLTLLDFTGSRDDNGHVMRAGGNRPSSCQSYGVIWDKTAKRNVSICKGGAHREQDLYLSTGNALEIILSMPTDPTFNTGDINQFMLKLEAIGCVDLIPPEDAWLKRSDDSIVIGCYSSRQTWHLHCEGEKWIGVFGNCSQEQDRVIESELKEESWSDDQVLTMVAVGGLTLTICLAVLCTGIVCLRRFSTQSKKQQVYRTLNFQVNSTRSQHSSQPIQSSMASDSTGNDTRRVLGVNEMPTYSVFVGENDFIDVDK